MFELEYMLHFTLASFNDVWGRFHGEHFSKRFADWLCFCVFCCFGCFLVVGCVFVWNRDGCWTMYRFHTSSLSCHLPMAAFCMHQLANLPVLCNMQSNVLNDLAKAKKRWTGKKLEQRTAEQLKLTGELKLSLRMMPHRLETGKPEDNQCNAFAIISPCGRGNSAISDA